MLRSAVAFISLCSYSTLLETVANEMTISFKTKWYEALLRQDITYFDKQEDVSRFATIISVNGAKYQRGIGNKLGLLFQFIATFIGGIVYAFYSSWETSLIVLTTIPPMAICGYIYVKMNTTKTIRANAAYAQAGSIVYTTVMNIRTIASLNATSTIISKFEKATNKAFVETTKQISLFGLADGSMMSSFLLSNIIVPLFGGYLLYDQVQENGCDPSGSIEKLLLLPVVVGSSSSLFNNNGTIAPVTTATCDPSGKHIFGAMFGIFFAAAVVPQINTTLEAFTEARAACYLALEAINDTSNAGTESEETDRNEDNAQIIEVVDGVLDDAAGASGGAIKAKKKKQTTTNKTSYSVADDDDDEEEEVEEVHDEDHVFTSGGAVDCRRQAMARSKSSGRRRDVIDPSSTMGVKLDSCLGDIQFHNVTFAYPTRKEINVLDEFNLKIDAGKTVAIVGPSGSGTFLVAVPQLCS